MAVMTQCDSMGMVLTPDPFKKTKSLLPGSLFDGLSSFPTDHSDVRLHGFTDQSHAFADLMDKYFLLICLFSTETVIEMGHNQGQFVYF